MHRYFIAGNFEIFLYFSILQKYCTIATCPGNIFQGQKRFEQNTIMRVKGIGPNMCQDRCLKMADCYSLNYDVFNFVCELNSAFAIGGSDPEIVTSVSFIYGDKGNKKPKGPCKDISCAPREECQATSSSTYACIITGCGPAPTISNSVSWSEPPLQHVGNNITYTCEAGYIIEGTDFSECNVSGHWSEPGVCKYDCGIPPSIAKANKAYTTTYETSVATYTCKNQHEMIGSPDYIVCNVGGWTSQQFQCIRNCGTPQGISNGIPVYSDTLLTAVATYQCSSNYVMIGNPSITCESSGWPIPQMQCLRDCGAPSSNVANAALGSGSNYKGSVRTFTCGYGYEATSADTTITCQNNGQWTAPNFSCRRTCPNDWREETTYNSCYRLFQDYERWNAAQSICESYDANLISLQTTAKRDRFFGYLQNHIHHKWVWVGGRRDGSIWRWEADGYVIDADIWKDDEPDNYYGCAYINHEKEMKSSYCSEELYYACEIPL